MIWVTVRNDSNRNSEDQRRHFVMEIYLICLASALIGGLLLSRLTKLLNLPAVTAYLVAGLLLGPFGLGRLNIPGFGFQSLAQVELLGIVTQTALGFIAFTIGNEFRQQRHHHRYFAGGDHHGGGGHSSDRPAPVLPGNDLGSRCHHPGCHRLGNGTGSDPDGGPPV